MEIVLEHEEVEALLKEALKSRGLDTENLRMVIRRNNKRGTIRVVLKTPRRPAS